MPSNWEVILPRIDIDILPRYERRRSVILTITHECNLHCKYCYEHKKSKEYMSVATAKEAIKYYMEEEHNLDKVEFQFFGGEPFLHFELIKEVVDWFHTKNWTKKHIFFIGTNGTILTEEIKEWLLKYPTCVWVGVSLDGIKEAHNLARSNSYDRVMENLPFFRQHYPTQPVKMTIGRETIPFVSESIINLEENDILFTANVVFEDVWGDVTGKQALVKEYAHQLKLLVDYYSQRPTLFPPTIISRDLSGVITEPSRLGATITKRWCGTGNEMVMVDVDNKTYPCQRFSTWVTQKPLPSLTLESDFVAWEPEECKLCPYITICPTCAGFNWEVFNNPDVRTTFHCDFFKAEILASCSYFAEVISNKSVQDLTIKRFSGEKIKRIIDSILVISNSH